MHQSPSGRVPELDRAVSTPAGQDSARWIKGDATDNAGVPFHRADWLPAVRIPQCYFAITTPAGKNAARRVKGNG